MTGACSIPAPRCGYVGPRIHGHDILLRDEHRAYIEPRILLPLCGDCHQGGIHELLKAAGLNSPMPGTPGVIVGRVGVTLGWLGLSRHGVVAVSCELLADVADVLGAQSRTLLRAEGLR